MSLDNLPRTVLAFSVCLGIRFELKSMDFRRSIECGRSQILSFKEIRFLQRP